MLVPQEVRSPQELCFQRVSVILERNGRLAWPRFFWWVLVSNSGAFKRLKVYFLRSLYF